MVTSSQRPFRTSLPKVSPLGLLFKTPSRCVSLLAVFTISDSFVCLHSYLLNADLPIRLYVSSKSRCLSWDRQFLGLDLYLVGQQLFL